MPRKTPWIGRGNGLTVSESNSGADIVTSHSRTEPRQGNEAPRLSTMRLPENLHPTRRTMPTSPSAYARNAHAVAGITPGALATGRSAIRTRHSHHQRRQRRGIHWRNREKHVSGVKRRICVSNVRPLKPPCCARKHNIPAPHAPMPTWTPIRSPCHPPRSATRRTSRADSDYTKGPKLDSTPLPREPCTQNRVWCRSF